MTESLLHPHQTLAGYKLVHLLGSGSCGEVWAAVADKSNVVALKVFADSLQAEQASAYEYDMSSRFQHAHILHPAALLAEHGRFAIAFPYCEGRSVDGVAASVSEALLWHLLCDIGSALSAVHAQGYGHFDVKPSNILWDGHDFLLSDFGACRQVNQLADPAVVIDASSYRFCAPELDTHPATACDIWSLGATIFYLYMGCHVFNGLGGKAQHQNSPLPYMRKNLPALSSLVQRCLSFNPAQRPTASEICDIAQQERARCTQQIPTRPLKVTVTNAGYVADGSFWPEEMK